MTAIIVPSSITANGTSLRTIRQRLNAAIGYAGTGVVTSIGTGLEPERYVISTSYRSDFASPTKFDEMFVYAQPASVGEDGVQRMAVAGGFDGPNGAIMADYPFDTCLPIGTGFECAALPALDYLGTNGSNRAIVLGLGSLPLIDLIDVTATADTLTYSLVNYPWPIKAIRRIYAPRDSTTDEHRRDVYGWRLINDAESPVLELGWSFNAGDVFTLEMVRAATTRVRQSDVWGDQDSSLGLVNDYDETTYDARTVVNAALPHALQFLSQRYTPGSKEHTDIIQRQQGARTQAGISRFFGSFRGNGAQRVGLRGGYRRGWGR